jgi:hypothetical protein
MRRLFRLKPRNEPTVIPLVLSASSLRGSIQNILDTHGNNLRPVLHVSPREELR